jgi:hypothetical protein
MSIVDDYRIPEKVEKKRVPSLKVSKAKSFEKRLISIVSFEDEEVIVEKAVDHKMIEDDTAKSDIEYTRDELVAIKTKEIAFHDAKHKEQMDKRAAWVAQRREFGPMYTIEEVERLAKKVTNMLWTKQDYHNFSYSGSDNYDLGDTKCKYVPQEVTGPAADALRKII